MPNRQIIVNSMFVWLTCLKYLFELKNYFGNSLLINAFNTNSDSVIVKTMAEIYGIILWGNVIIQRFWIDEGVANRETLMIIMIGVSGFFIIMWAIITITKCKK